MPISRFQQRLPLVLEAMQTQPELTLNELAALAHCAPSHFQRLFSLHTGLSVMRYRRLLTLDRAASQLAFRASSVLDIALEAGFQSSEAFTRAFQQFVGQSPRAFRQHPDWLAWQDAITQLTNSRASSAASPSYEVQLASRQVTPVALLEHRGAPWQLGNSIRQFIAFRKQHRLPPSISATYNLLYDDPTQCEDGDYRFGLACECAAVPSNDQAVRAATLAAGWYASVQIHGSDANIEPAVRWLLQQWLPKQGLQLADQPILLQRLKFFPDVPADQAESLLLVPLLSSDEGELITDPIAAYPQQL